MEIYLLGTRMFMIMEVNERFSFDAKAEADRDNPKVQEWERLMWKFQRPLPEAKPGEKWILMERVFKLGVTACCGTQNMAISRKIARAQRGTSGRASEPVVR